ncbi:MAG: hypothetical protein AMJ46_00305 [Latescibacteria bacterium DG_63]|nr:MAG: hypothetical protein AMJ46_00305 [Latescibacteria bacterium DG_63]
MFTRGWFTDFVVTFVVTLVVAVIVTLLWNLIAHGSPAVDWATSFRLAIILGFALPIASRVSKQGQK